MSNYKIRYCPLPTTGTIAGSPAGPQVTIPAGTKVYIIMFQHLAYNYAYLDEESALKALREMELKPPATEWNFFDRFPTKIARPGSSTRNQQPQKETP